MKKKSTIDWDTSKFQSQLEKKNRKPAVRHLDDSQYHFSEIPRAAESRISETSNLRRTSERIYEENSREALNRHDKEEIQNNSRQIPRAAQMIFDNENSRQLRKTVGRSSCLNKSASSNALKKRPNIQRQRNISNERIYAENRSRQILILAPENIKEDQDDLLLTQKTPSCFQGAPSQLEYRQLYNTDSVKKKENNLGRIDSKQERIWRNLQNLDNSQQQQDSYSSISYDFSSRQIEKTSKKDYHRKNVEMNNPPVLNEEDEYDISRDQNNTQKSNDSTEKNKLKFEDKKKRQKDEQEQNKIKTTAILFKRRTVPILQQRRANQKRETIKLTYQELIPPFEAAERLSRYPFRKTRISPVKYWLGERVVYKKNEVGVLRVSQQ